jgi:hypothetical protein
MTLTPSVRAISLLNFPCLAKRFACASFLAISPLECCFRLGIVVHPRRRDGVFTKGFNVFSSVETRLRNDGKDVSANFA